MTAPPGSGKTTIVPLALLGEPWLKGKKIIILQPRRIAARAACFRMASLLNEPPGKTVGYNIRHDRVGCKDTRIEVVTEGILTRFLQNNPDLPGVGLVIFDEFHERSIHADLALALCLDLCQINEQLRLLIMSATLDVNPIASLLGQVPIIERTGKSYEVQLEYLEKPPTLSISKTVAAGVLKVIQDRLGDILVFLPGVGEIKATEKLLLASLECNNIKIQALYGDLSQRDQDIILHPKDLGKRRIVLATPIAETSLTIDGIVNVVDSGWNKQPQFNPANGLTTLVTKRVAKDSANQRAGRAGRLAPGYCLRLWDKPTHHSLAPFHPPEILHSDLSSLALELLLWGTADPSELLWLDTPRESNYRNALSLLRELGAIDVANRLTGTGRAMAKYPLHPRLARLMVVADKNEQHKLGAEICALLTEKDIIDCRKNPTAELSLRLELLKQFKHGNLRKKMQRSCRPDLCKRVIQTSRSFSKSKVTTGQKGGNESVASMLLSAYPDRLAKRLPDQFGRYKLASGRLALLFASDPLNHSEYLVVASVDGGKKEGRIFLAEPIDLSTIREDHPQLIRQNESVYWDQTRGKVVASRTLSVGSITLKESPLSGVCSQKIVTAVKRGVQTIGIGKLLSEPKVIQLQSRVQLLSNTFPHLDLPDLSTKSLEEDLSWLEPYLAGVHNLQQLHQLNFYEILFSRFTYKSQQHLARETPEFFTVPTGSKIRIQYSGDNTPVLPVRIQELFGLSTTPSICGGKIPLLLHLLSPAQRPIQITSDLKGFWQSSYHDVKKDLKGRYPKHYWPDNPMTSDATKYTKKKSNYSHGS